MLRFYTAGESHGQALLAFISGLPAQLPIDVKSINHELRRRQLGYGRGGRQKIEKDTAEIFAGVRHGQKIRGRESLSPRGRVMRILRGRRNSTTTMRVIFWSELRRAKPRHGWRRALLQNCFCGNSTQKSQVIRFRWGTCAWRNLPRGRKFRR